MFKYQLSKNALFMGPKMLRFLCVEVALILIICLLHLYPIINIAVDQHSQRCLENAKVAALIHIKPDSQNIGRGDLIFWKPFGPLEYVKDEYIVKRVVGVAGDLLRISGERVTINNRLVATGLPSASQADLRAHVFDKFEVIPSDQFFVLGDNPLSYDSRYWGYVAYSNIMGTAIALF